MRQEVERKIAAAFINQALAAGFTISIDNGGDEDEETKPSNNQDEILAGMFQTDEEHLYVWNPTNGKRVGWVFFVYGNDGWDVISDYSVNMEPLMSEANKISDHYAD
jgi:hypothetical protein